MTAAYAAILACWHTAYWRGGDKPKIIADLRTLLGNDPDASDHARVRKATLDDLNAACNGQIAQRDHLGSLELDLLSAAMEGQ